MPALAVTTEGLPSPIGTQLAAALGQVQALKIKVAAGTTATTNIAIAGIATTSVILSVLQFDINTGNVVNVIDRTGEASATSAGNIQLSTTNTTGDVLVVFFLA